MTRRKSNPSPRRRPINLSRGAFHHLAAALGLALLTSSVHADWTLQDCNFKDEKGLTINTWNPTDGLSATNSTGKLVTFPTRDILLLTSNQKAPSDPASRAWRLALRNGDVLYGDPMGVSGKSLLYKIPELGSLAIPLKRVSTLTCPVYGPAATGDKPKRVPSAPDHDLIIFRDTGDKLEGLVAGFDETNIQIATEGSDTPTALALSKIDSIIFGGAKPPREIPPLSIRFSFTSGSVYTVPLSGDSPFSWTLSKIKVKDAAGTEHTANTDRIVSAELLGGRIVYLTELDFAKEDQTSFLGTSWPAQINKNALGQPLKVAGTTYSRGIGVHTQSTLVYQLDGSFDTLSLRVGLDDSAAPLGQAQVSIILDGKTLWPPAGTSDVTTGPAGPAKILKPGEISEELTLPLKAGKRLEFHADPTARLDVQGRVNWLNIALRRQ